VREPSAADVGEGTGGGDVHGDVHGEAKTGGRAGGEGGLEERVKEEGGGKSDPSEEADIDALVARLQAQLNGIKGRRLHFNALAFKEIKKLDTSQDADLCTLHEARAFRFKVPWHDGDEAAAEGEGLAQVGGEEGEEGDAGRVRGGHALVVVGIELKADRFLRRMVRVLVSTALREARAQAPDHSLLDIVLSGERRLAATAAPSEGLCFLGAGYEPYDMAAGGIPLILIPHTSYLVAHTS
jgi:hypothetical protein